MAEPQRTVVTFENGLDEFTEPSRLADGFATVLENWVPEPDGSLRSRIGWLAQLNGGQPTARAVIGLGYNPRNKQNPADAAHTPALFIANRKTPLIYEFFHVSVDGIDDPLENLVSLENVTISGTGATTDEVVPMVMAGGKMLYCSRWFGGGARGSLRAWDGPAGTAAAIANSRVGRAMCYYRNRVFTAGGLETTDPASGPSVVNTHNTQPWRLWFSGLNDITAWDTTSLTNPAGFIEVGKDDGESIEWIQPFDQGILVAKTNSLYYLAGQGPSTFQLIPLDAGEGAPGRSIVITPYGAIIVGRNDIFLYDGNYPVPISKGVSETWGMVGPWVTAAYSDGQVYIYDAGKSDHVIYDLTTEAWHSEESVSGAEMLSMSFTQDDVLYTGIRSSTTFPLVFYRHIPTGARQKDQSFAETMHLMSPELWLAGAATEVTLRHAYIRFRQRGTGGATNLVVKAYRNGTLQDTKNIAPRAAAGVYRQRLDFGPTAYYITLEASHVADGCVFDIEELVIDWEKEKQR